MKRYLPLVLAIFAFAMLASSGIGVRAGWWSFRTGFTILKWAGIFGVATMFVAALFLVVPKLRTGYAVPIIALVIGGWVAHMPYHWLKLAKASAPIHDISTDTDRPPEFIAVLPFRADAANPAEYGGPEVAAQQHKTYPDIQPLMLKVKPDSAFRLARAAAEALKWEVVAADAATGRLEATATTQWFGFKDDVVVRIEPAAQGSRIDARSVSRVGRGDVGTNAARIRKYFTLIRDKA